MDPTFSANIVQSASRHTLPCESHDFVTADFSFVTQAFLLEGQPVQAKGHLRS